jgi:pyruvate dehydrogenase E2 component (dihydrolipoamide acetyltransferase)
MNLEITIPKLGMTMKEATIARWNKADGDWVEEKEVILVIETEKITYEIEAPQAGYLRILESEGAVLPVGAKVGILTQEKLPEVPISAPKELKVDKAHAPLEASKTPLQAPTARIKASPLAKRIAKEHGISLELVAGTGPGGRILRADVLGFLQSQPVQVPGGPSAPLPPEAKKPLQAVPLSKMRRQIMEHMHRSLQETAQMTLTREVDATQLVRLREVLQGRHRKDGVKISYNAILVKMVARLLREHPWVNAGLEGDMIVQWGGVHVGVAMELDEGLIVPVVRDADTLSILEIERVLQGLFERARSKKLLPDEIRGGTFTITNLGHLGVDAFTPILNRPESAILGVGRIVEAPVVSTHSGEPKLEFAKRMVLSLTVDHRILDGAPAARFLGGLAEILENPMLLVD